MPILSQMDFATNALVVRYRGSDQPQDLLVDVEVADAPELPFALIAMRTLVDTINQGVGAGALFDPRLSAATIVSGPTDQEALGTSFHWHLRVAAVDPRFMRNMVEELRRSGYQADVRFMSIKGSLPLDDSALSVDELTVRRWLDDYVTYPESFPSTAFASRWLGSAASGSEASIRLELAGPIGASIRVKLEHLCIDWLNAIRNYPDFEGDEIFFEPSSMLPTFGQGGREFSAFYRSFFFKSEPSYAALSNMLQRFHATVAPIHSAELEV